MRRFAATTTGSLKAFFACGLIACTALSLSAQAQAPQAAAAPVIDTAAWQSAADKANASVIGIEVVSTRGARSAATLGRQRAGTAVVIGDDGLALTIGYLILEAENLAYITPQGKRFPARVVAYDLASGFGLVAPLVPAGVPKVALGDSDAVKEQEALLVSTGGEDGEYGLTRLVSQRKFSGYWEYHLERALFTSPPISNHGGAGVFNQAGELLGIGSLYVGDSAGVREGLNSEAPSQRPRPGNMFVPVNLLKPILAELQSQGFSQASVRPWMGISSVERDGQIVVTRVNPRSPASEAGVQVGDVIVQIEGQPVKALESLYKTLWQQQPEATVELLIEQAGGLRKAVPVKTVDRMKTLARAQGV